MKKQITLNNIYIFFLNTSIVSCMFTESQVKSHLRSRKCIIADWHILLLYLDNMGHESIEVYGLISNLKLIIVGNLKPA